MVWVAPLQEPACSDCLCNPNQWLIITGDCGIICVSVCVGGVTNSVSCCISLMCLEQLNTKITGVCTQRTIALGNKACLVLSRALFVPFF